VTLRSYRENKHFYAITPAGGEWQTAPPAGHNPNVHVIGGWMGPRGVWDVWGKENTAMSGIEPGSSNPFSRHCVASTGRMRFAGRFHVKASNRSAVLLDTLSPRARKHRTLHLSDITHPSQWGSAVWQSVCAHNTVLGPMNCKCCIGCQAATDGLCRLQLSGCERAVRASVMCRPAGRAGSLHL
jgi:hypothetical protein